MARSAAAFALTAGAAVFAASIYLQAQAVSAGAADTQQLLQRYCISCHNTRVKTAALALDAVDLQNVAAQPQVWEKVVTKLRTAAMPPVGRPRPDAAAYDAGFLGPRYAALAVKPRDPQFVTSGFAELGVDNLAPPAGVAPRNSAARLALLADLQSRMLEEHPTGPTRSHDTTLKRAIRLMNSEAGQVFDLATGQCLDDESVSLRSWPVRVVDGTVEVDG